MFTVNDHLMVGHELQVGLVALMKDFAYRKYVLVVKILTWLRNATFLTAREIVQVCSDVFSPQYVWFTRLLGTQTLYSSRYTTKVLAIPKIHTYCMAKLTYSVIIIIKITRIANSISIIV